MEKTAIDWLIDQLEKYELYSKISFQCLKEIEEAKERDSLEKINNFNEGWMNCEKWFEEKKLCNHIFDKKEIEKSTKRTLIIYNTKETTEEEAKHLLEILNCDDSTLWDNADHCGVQIIEVPN
jgi:hypothetical protein